MNSQEFKKNICRICLDENVVLDWNNILYEYITFKDCYYKYTQLEWPVVDPFSPMLCQICVNGLQNIHSLILKALESHKYFHETNLLNTEIDDSTIAEDDIKYTPTEFETVVVEKLEGETIIQDYFVYEKSDEEFVSESVKTKGGKRSKRYATDTPVVKRNKIQKPIEIVKKNEECVNGNTAKTDNSEYNLLTTLDRSCTKSGTKRKSTKQGVEKNNRSEDKKEINQKEEDISLLKKESLDDKTENCGKEVEPKIRKKKPRMCSICSKILHNKYAVQMHEKTHIENRERKETCKVCGLKFYDKNSLHSHVRIHKENREKKHKCEFCNKAFYDKGGLNVHRRIHLGQMVTCILCSKQYYRQCDLDKHMSSHSATTINSDTKKKSKYLVRCKYCDKSILSTSFKSHTAAHLNEPLMKCSICSKEFFRRESCVLHVKKVHQKTNEEYNDFIIQYKKNRISHLFLEQKADIQFTDE